MNIKLIFVFVAYQFLQILILPIVFIYLAIRKFKKKPVFGSFKERFGFIPKNINNNKKTIWLHAVSVGEILSIETVINQIKKEDSNAICYVTCGTIAGKNIAKKHLKADYISFLPYDFLIIMLIAFNRINPNKIIIIEAEIWPNFLMLAKRLDIPLYLLNARITERSAQKYFTFKSILKNIFNLFDQILTQTDCDKILFEKLGVEPQKVKVLGNIKTLNVLEKKEITKKIILKNSYKILLVGSIHPGELNIYLDLFNKLKLNIKNLKLILAPRHFNWEQELIKKVSFTQEKYFIYNEKNNLDLDENLDKILSENNILLICKLGELFKLYQIADIFYLGGTFVNIGGHNLLEPAVWGIPSIIGPYYQNTKIIAKELEKNNGIFITNDFETLYLKSKSLILNSEISKNMGSNSFDWLNKQTNIVAQKIKEFLN